MTVITRDVDGEGDANLLLALRGSVMLYKNHTILADVTIALVDAPGDAPRGPGAVVEVQVGDRIDRHRSTPEPR